MLIQEFYDSFYAPLLLIDSNPNTTRQYNTNIRRMTKLLGRSAQLSDLTRDNITRLAASMTQAGRSPSTTNKVVSQLRALLNEAVRRKLADHDRLPRLKEYVRAPTAWSSAQITLLLAACEAQTGMIGNLPARLWWTAIHHVIFDTGLRIGACIKLRWAYVDWERESILVPAEIQKDKEDQLFKLHADTLALLRRIQSEREMIFPFDKCYSNIWYYYTKILKEANLPRTRRDKFHRMRRTTATYYEAAGGDATELLGHASRDTTRRYIDKSMVQRLHACDVVPRPSRKI